MSVKNDIALSLVIVAGMSMTYTAYGDPLPDPTRPANYSQVTEIKAKLPNEFRNWNVRAIRTSDNGRNAIVNGTLVKVGDEIDSAKIIDITRNTVVLAYDSKQLVLKLIPAEIKKKHSNEVIQKSD